MSEPIKYRESKVTAQSTKACAAAAFVFICGIAVAQEIRIDDQPDLVIGKSLPKTEHLRRAATATVAADETPIALPATIGSEWAVEIRDVTLANTFQRWATAAGWRVRWDAAKNVMVEAPDVFKGRFEDAVTSQLASPGIAYSNYPLEVCFYPNTPPLARITRKGDQTKECQ
ncbi:TcpQ domain-containing protein [Variovorax ginsengisoli]|uniref:Toxin co-regulated pilus biosynthesis protein Q C-terminal domain-containing protein n=1 Tax=Variovorax ginsengisoli TaxID=363844 RepID=A0ABT9SDH7_9BURK|nr:TcpQ domain-containing protein [Variovorax ginsengisoli]MDP9902409.1 hypothetical protein [Variovorax ginsengisoli]